jgi:hypothetical protein
MAASTPASVGVELAVGVALEVAVGVEVGVEVELGVASPPSAGSTLELREHAAHTTSAATVTVLIGAGNLAHARHLTQTNHAAGASAPRRLRDPSLSTGPALPATAEACEHRSHS